MSTRGRVIQSTGKWYRVETDDGILDCRLPGKFRLSRQEVTNPVAVGDLVEVETAEDNTGMITRIEERRNWLPRQATHGRRGEQVLASNIDRAWSVVSIRQPKLKTGFIDRFLVTCEAYGLPAGIVVNKMDLAGRQDRRFLDDLVNLYEGIGYPVYLTSIRDPETVDLLRRACDNQTSVFVGPSGAGKTSILNSIDPGLALATGEVSGSSNKGRHTTTAARLIRIGNGGYIVDTPGIRELGLVNIEPYELSLYYPEMVEPRQQCKFNNCTHSHEPGCGITAAFEQGAIHPERYHSYLNILESLVEDEK